MATYFWIVVILAVLVYGYQKWKSIKESKRLVDAFVQACNEGVIHTICEAGFAIINRENSPCEDLSLVYRTFLSYLKLFPDLEPDCLTAGRRAYSCSRPEKATTNVDESAIQNDIQAHRKQNGLK